MNISSCLFCFSIVDMILAEIVEQFTWASTIPVRHLPWADVFNLVDLFPEHLGILVHVLVSRHTSVVGIVWNVPVFVVFVYFTVAYGWPTITGEKFFLAFPFVLDYFDWTVVLQQILRRVCIWSVYLRSCYLELHLFISHLLDKARILVHLDSVHELHHAALLIS